MLPRIACHASGIIRNVRLQQKSIPLSAVRKLQPLSTPPVHTFRYLSTKKDGIGADQISSSASEAKQGVERENGGKYEPNNAAASTFSPVGPHVDTADQQRQLQPTAKNTPSSLSLAVPPKEALSSSKTLASSSTTTTTNIPKTSSADSPPAPSTGKSATPTKTPMKKNASNDVSFAKFYDKAFRLWSERSGTSEILALKESVNEAGAAFDTASAAVTTDRRNLDGALRKWERASGQHLQLLQRRESWTPEDAQRFADFVSLEITSRAELEQARHDLSRSEELLTKSQLDYINKMRRRYHEEQIWQDQWRVLGTYGTWTLIVLNSCVFLGSQFFQRRRERDRTETIERLIRETRSDAVPSQGQNAEADHKPSEASTIAKEDDLNEKDANGTEGVGNNNALSMEEELVPINPPELEPKTTMIPEGVEKSSPEVDNELHHRVHPVMERMGMAISSVGSFVNQWEHKVRSRMKGIARFANQKLCEALSTNIVNEMPKSVSEIHVPSAIIGASVGGVVATIIFSSFSNRGN